MEIKAQQKPACWLGGKNTAKDTGFSFESKFMAIIFTNSY